MMLLLLCGDVEVNPRPVSYPCAGCGQNSVAEDDLANEYVTTAVCGVMLIVVVCRKLSTVHYLTTALTGYAQNAQ